MTKEHPTLTAFDGGGRRVESFAKVAELKLAAAPSTVSVCLNLHNGSQDWDIDITVSLDSYPYPILGGTIKGTICDSPNWEVTGGSLGTSLQVNGQFTGSGSCASTVTIVGNYQNPSSYTGTYGFNGASSSFNHTTLFRGWKPCR